MKYAVSEIVATIQGEGFHSGRRCVLLRFSGCNLWNGTEEGRKNGMGTCSRWCDTAFHHSEQLSLSELLARVEHLRLPGDPLPFVVLTGGEPTLQLTSDLVCSLKRSGWQVAIETNGTISDPLLSELDWITVSPKIGAPLLLSFAHEVKVVLPGAMPPAEGWSDADLERLAARYPNALSLVVQPQDEVPHGTLHRRALHRCAEFVLSHPRWRFSCQLQKLVGLP